MNLRNLTRQGSSLYGITAKHLDFLAAGGFERALCQQTFGAGVDRRYDLLEFTSHLDRQAASRGQWLELSRGRGRAS